MGRALAAMVKLLFRDTHQQRHAAIVATQGKTLRNLQMNDYAMKQTVDVGVTKGCVDGCNVVNYWYHLCSLKLFNLFVGLTARSWRARTRTSVLREIYSWSIQLQTTTLCFIAYLILTDGIMVAIIEYWLQCQTHDWCTPAPC